MNIVEELRDCRGRGYGHSWELCERAADEIENLQQDIATAEAKIKERDDWIDDDAKNLSDNEHEIRRLNDRVSALEAELNCFHQAVSHVTENGKTTRSFSTGEWWAMVHKDRLSDLEIAEEQLVVSNAKGSNLETALAMHDEIERETYEQAKIWKDLALKLARGELRHRNAGDCPDADYPKWRDPMCTVCKIMGE